MMCWRKPRRKLNSLPLLRRPFSGGVFFVKIFAGAGFFQGTAITPMTSFSPAVFCPDAGRTAERIAAAIIETTVTLLLIYSNLFIVFAISFFTLSGSPAFPETSFNAEMMNSGYSIRAGKASGDDDSEILSNAMASGMDLNDSIAVLRIGVADSVETPGRTVLAYVSSTLGIYDRDTSELIFSDNTTSSIGSGESYSEAVMDAFTNCGRNLASTVITYL